MTVSAEIRQAVYAQETDACPIILLTISHAALSDDIRVSSDAVDTVHDSETYLACEFEIALPDDSDDAIPRSRLIIQNVDRQIVEAIRSISSPPSVTMKVVLAADPDTVELGPMQFTLRNVDYDVLTVEGEVEGPDILNEAYPPDSFSPRTHPGIFPL